MVHSNQTSGLNQVTAQHLARSNTSEAVISAYHFEVNLITFVCLAQQCLNHNKKQPVPSILNQDIVYSHLSRSNDYGHEYLEFTPYSTIMVSFNTNTMRQRINNIEMRNMYNMNKLGVIKRSYSAIMLLYFGYFLEKIIHVFFFSQ